MSFGSRRSAVNMYADPVGILPLERVTEPRVERSENLLVVESNAVGRVRDEDARTGGRGHLQYVGLLELHEMIDAEGTQVRPRELEHFAVAVAAEYRKRGNRTHAFACALPEPRPCRFVVRAQFLKSEVSFRPGALSSAIIAASHRKVPLPHVGSSSADWASHFVRRRMPAARFSRSGASPVGFPISTLEKRLAGGVQIERRVRRRQERMNAGVGRLRVHVGPLSAFGPKRVAHCVLHSQRDEIEALDRRTYSSDIDADRVFDVNQRRHGIARARS